MRRNHYSAGAEQLGVTEKITQGCCARVIKAAARFIQEEEIGCGRKCHNDGKAASLTVGESPWCSVKKFAHLKALRECFGARHITHADVRTCRSRAKKEA